MAQERGQQRELRVVRGDDGYVCLAHARVDESRDVAGGEGGFHGVRLAVVEERGFAGCYVAVWIWR